MICNVPVAYDPFPGFPGNEGGLQGYGFALAGQALVPRPLAPFLSACVSRDGSQIEISARSDSHLVIHVDLCWLRAFLFARLLYRAFTSVSCKEPRDKGEPPLFWLPAL